MNDVSNIESQSNRQWIDYPSLLFLPLLLAVLFFIQAWAFDCWLNLSPNQYIWRFFFVNFALGLLLYGPSVFFKKRGRYVYLFLISFFISIIFLSQFIYFEYAKSFLQVSVLHYSWQAFSVTGTVKKLIGFGLLLFICNFLLVGVAYWLTFKKNYREIIVSNKGKLIFAIFIIAVVSFGYYFLLSQEEKQWGNTSRLYKDVYDMNTLVEKMGIVNFSFEDAIKYFLRINSVSDADKNFLVSLAKSQVVSQKNGKYFGIDKGKNLIFLQIESLENAVINQKINGEEITPNLNDLAAGSLYFSNYYTQVGPGNTADAEFSTLNSMYPLQDDVVFVDYAQNNFNALPKLLVKNGYGTYNLNGDVPTFWNRANIYPALGYQKQISKDSYIMSRPIGKGPTQLGDEDFLNQSSAKMQNFKQPFFSTLITESSHTPFELPEDLQTLPIPNDGTFDWWQYEYLESIHYVDKAIGEFIDQLKQENLYNNSVIVIYGDHGSYTNISDVLGNEDSDFPGLVHGQVPLIILNSGIENGEIKIPASHLDLLPTITNLMGIKAPSDILGQDIFNAKNPVVTYRNIGSGDINTILTQEIAFKADNDGVFNDGVCLKIPEKVSLPISDCQNIYLQQSDMVKASDIMVRGNLSGLFLSSLKH